MSFTQHELRDTGFIIVRAIHDGARNDDSLEPLTAERTPWSSVRFVLERPLLVRDGRGATVVHPGQAFAALDYRSSAGRSVSNSSDVLSIVWRSRPDRPCGHGPITLSPRARAALLQLAATITTRDTATAIGAAREAVAALQALGIPVADVPLTSASPAAHEFARALERVFFPLSARPMAIDLARALGVGERQALRRANAFFGDYYTQRSSWREYLYIMRVGLSTFFIGHPRARTDQVSRLLGFSSPTSLCHALHDAGLPSPLEVQRALLAT